MRLPENVKRGVVYLDEREPDWRERIDPYRLDMASNCRCILGQLDGDYGNGLDERHLSNQDAAALGFFRRGRQTWDGLTAAWRKVLAA